MGSQPFGCDGYRVRFVVVASAFHANGNTPATRRVVLSGVVVAVELTRSPGRTCGEVPVAAIAAGAGDGVTDHPELGKFVLVGHQERPFPTTRARTPSTNFWAWSFCHCGTSLLSRMRKAMKDIT